MQYNSFCSFNKATKCKTQTCMTLEVSYSRFALVPCPDCCALSGRFFPLAEHFRKHGARAVAMAALEERRRAWHPEDRHRLGSHNHTTFPLIVASNLQHKKTIHMQPRRYQRRSSNIPKIIHNDSNADLPKTPTFSNTKALLQLCTLSHLHPHTPAYTVPLGSSVLCMLLSSNSKNMAERKKQDQNRGLVQTDCKHLCVFLYVGLNPL